MAMYIPQFNQQQQPNAFQQTDQAMQNMAQADARKRQAEMRRLQMQQMEQQIAAQKQQQKVQLGEIERNADIQKIKANGGKNDLSDYQIAAKLREAGHFDESKKINLDATNQMLNVMNGLTNNLKGLDPTSQETMLKMLETNLPEGFRDGINQMIDNGGLAYVGDYKYDVGDDGNTYRIHRTTGVATKVEGFSKKEQRKEDTARMDTRLMQQSKTNLIQTGEPLTVKLSDGREFTATKTDAQLSAEEEMLKLKTMRTEKRAIRLEEIFKQIGKDKGIVGAGTAHGNASKALNIMRQHPNIYKQVITGKTTGGKSITYTNTKGEKETITPGGFQALMNASALSAVYFFSGAASGEEERKDIKNQFIPKFFNNQETATFMLSLLQSTMGRSIDSAFDFHAIESGSEEDIKAAAEKYKEQLKSEPDGLGLRNLESATAVANRITELSTQYEELNKKIKADNPDLVLMVTPQGTYRAVHKSKASRFLSAYPEYIPYGGVK